MAGASCFLKISHRGNAFCNSRTPASVVRVPLRFSHRRFFNAASSFSPASVICVSLRSRSCKCCNPASSFRPASVIRVPPQVQPECPPRIWQPRHHIRPPHRKMKRRHRRTQTLLCLLEYQEPVVIPPHPAHLGPGPLPGTHHLRGQSVQAPPHTWPHPPATTPLQPCTTSAIPQIVHGRPPQRNHPCRSQQRMLPPHSSSNYKHHAVPGTEGKPGRIPCSYPTRTRLRKPEPGK